MDDQQLREALRPGESPAADAAKGTKEMVTTEQMVEGNDDSGVEFEPITTDSGMTLKTDREAQLWRDGFEEGFGKAEENYDQDYELGNFSDFLPSTKAYLVLEKVRSMLPEFTPPTKRNGEQYVPTFVTVRGQFVIVRYLGWEPIQGPRLDEFFLDIFYNSEGREVFRAQSKIVEPPPEPPPLSERLRYALYLIFGIRPQFE
jgi:hypothetical protein